MKSKIFFITLILALFLSSLVNNLPIVSAKTSKDFSQSVSEIVMDANSKRILHQNNIHEKKAHNL